jgi:hypothetical protein
VSKNIFGLVFVTGGQRSIANGVQSFACEFRDMAARMIRRETAKRQRRFAA